MQWASIGMNENDIFFEKMIILKHKAPFLNSAFLVGIAFIMKEKEYHDTTACSNPGSNLAISQKIQRFWFTLYAHTNYFPIRKILK
jgi:hypothetical protein